MSVFHNNMLVGASQPSGVRFDTTLIPNSVWMDGSSDGFTAASSNFSNQTGKEFTLGTWFQLTELGVTGAIFCAGDSSAYTSVRHDTDNKIYFQTKIGNAILKTQAVFRDIGWYHLLVSVDTTQATTVNRVRIFVNGVQQTLDGTYPAQDRVYDFDRAEVHEVGDSIENGAFEGYLAQSFMIGSKSVQQGDFSTSDFLDTFTLGTNGSQVIPKAHSEIKTLVDAGSSNSYLLQYENSGALGTDSSTNTNNFTATSMDSDNQSENTPSNSYPILNVLDPTTATASSGNLNFAGPSADDKAAMRTTIGIPDNSGKFYFEYEMTGGSNDALMFGIAGPGEASGGYDDWVQDITPQVAVYTESGSNKLYVDGAVTTSSLFGSAPSSGDIISVAYDSATRKVWLALNNTYAGGGNPAAGSGETATLSGSGTAFPTVSARGSSDTLTLRFDSDDFSHSAPSGYRELNTKNLTAPEYQGIDYFDSTLYEGTGGQQRVGDFVPFEDTFAIGNSAVWFSEDIRRLSHTYSSEATATSDNSSDSAVYRKATISFWVKFIETNDSDQQVFISQSNSGQTEVFSVFAHGTDDQVFVIIDPSGSDNNRQFKFSKGLLSTQNWSNVVINLDTNNSTAADRMKVWINGNAVTNTDTSRPYTNMSQGQALNLFRDEQLMIGHLSPGDTYNSVYNFNSYLAEFHVIDGSAKTPDNFGQVDTSTNRWVPKDYKTNVGTYGNRGFYLKFDGTPGAGSGSDMGKDSSGNNIHLTEETHGSGSAWAAADKSNDTPSNNLAVFDAVDRIGSASPPLSEGATKFTGADNGGRYISGFPFTTGKFYWELDVVDAGTSFYPGFFTPAGIAYSSTAPWVSNSGSFVIAPVAGHWLGINGSGTTNVTNNYTAFIGDGDRMFFAYDADNKFAYVGEVGSGGSGSTLNYYSLGGAVTGDPTSGAGGVGAAPFGLNQTGEQTFYFGIVSGGTDVIANLIADPTKFNGTPPTGYVALTQDNMDATSDKITALAIIKNRDAADDTIVQDRLLGTTSYLSTTQNDSGTAATSFGSGGSDLATTNANVMQRFLQRGVQVGNDENVNTVNESYVLSQWLLGGSATTGSSITTGATSDTMATTGIVADAGHLSIVEYTGTGTAGDNFLHGLGAKPELVIVKRFTGSATNSDWIVATQGLGLSDNNYFFLQYNLGVQTSTALVRTGDITNDIVVVGSGVAVNTISQTHRAYNFRSVPGVCKVGSYVGNNNADGTYVHTGFKPAFVLTKTSSSGAWGIMDSVREPENPVIKRLFTNSNSAEDEDGEQMDFLSDGFKLRKTGGFNNNAQTYIYLAMANIGGNGTLPPIYGR